MSEPEGRLSIEDCVYHRCVEHYAVPQQNWGVIGGSECGGCISAERDEIADVMWEVLLAHHLRGLTARCEDCEREIRARLDGPRDAQIQHARSWQQDLP